MTVGRRQKYLLAKLQEQHRVVQRQKDVATGKTNQATY